MAGLTERVALGAKARVSAGRLKYAAWALGTQEDRQEGSLHERSDLPIDTGELDDTGGDQAWARDGEPDPGESSQFLEFASLKRFTVRRRIGAGGMGVV